jgi:hypothetical protein
MNADGHNEQTPSTRYGGNHGQLVSVAKSHVECFVAFNLLIIEEESDESSKLAFVAPVVEVLPHLWKRRRQIVDRGADRFATYFHDFLTMGVCVKTVGDEETHRQRDFH